MATPAHRPPTGPAPSPAVGDPASPDAWGRFLDVRVGTGLDSFLDNLRADALNRAQALESEVLHWMGALAVALLEARRRGFDRADLLDLHYWIQVTPPEYLGPHVGIPAAILEEGSLLLTRKEEMARIAAEAGVEGILGSYRVQQEQAAFMGRSELLEVSQEQERIRALVRDHPVPFRSQAFFDRGEGPSRVLLSLCLLRGIQLPEEEVPFIPPKAPGEGRSRTRTVGLVEAFLRVLPGSGERPGTLLVHHAGPLGPKARERAYKAASQAVGLGYLPSRGEILVRLLAAAGERNCLAALAAEARRKAVEKEASDRGGDEERRPRHGLVLKARINAVERECLRLLEEAEIARAEGAPLISTELALRRSGQLLRKDRKVPEGSNPFETVAWTLADPRGEGVEVHPRPPRR